MQIVTACEWPSPMQGCQGAEDCPLAAVICKDMGGLSLRAPYASGLLQVRTHTAILQQQGQDSRTAPRSPRQQQLRKPQSMAAAVERAKRRLQEANIDLPEPLRPADPPVIKGQPRDVQAKPGSDVELSVAAMVRLVPYAQ